MLNKKPANRFNFYTISAVYFLILVGGIVRSMGAGMGCPDWPKCFGSYVPPASTADLPDNYEEMYVKVRVEKNRRLANTLNAFGFDQLAARVSQDPSILKTTTFDAQKAWVEYINRLVGVLIGFLIILNMVFSFSYRKSSRWIPILGVIGFVLVVFQGWVGSLVVSTNLLPGFISFHMILALLLVAVLLIQQYMMQDKPAQLMRAKNWISALLVLFTIQVIFGTQIREQIDMIHASGVARSNWIEELGMLFYVHRSYSLVIAAIIGWIFYKNYRAGVKSVLLYALVGVLIAEVLLGAIMAYFSFPAFAQPSHLFLGTIAFGVIFYLFLWSNFNRLSA